MELSGWGIGVIAIIVELEPCQPQACRGRVAIVAGWGGKVIRTKTKKTDNRANLAFRQAAASLIHSKSALGNFYRRMRTKLGTPKAVVAAAHKLARIVYHLLKEQVPFEAIPPEQADSQYRERAIRQLQRKAQRLGVTVVVEPIAQST